MVVWMIIVCAAFSSCLQPTETMTEACQCLQQIGASDIEKIKVVIGPHKHSKSFFICLYYIKLALHIFALTLISEVRHQGRQ